MVLVTESHLELKGRNQSENIKISFEWLRENCRCGTCYNEITNQRNIRIFEIDENIHPISFSISGNNLHIQWCDSHQSNYDMDWLESQSKNEEKPQEILWSGNQNSKVEFVTATDIKSKHGITRLVRSLMEYGVGFVTEVNPELESTEEVIRCVGPPQQTLFGGMWQFSDKMDHMDTAYTNQALDAHTDTSYFIEPAGLIIFHCTKRNCSGGQTLLVDGFRAARDVQLEDPEAYQCLRSVHTEFQYIEKGHNLRILSSIIHHWPDETIKQIRFNLYDRSPRLPLPASKTALFYNSLRLLTRVISKPKGHWWLTLEPGTVAFINNWRVLHGRSNFTGQRTITGAYVSMGNLLSRGRLLGIVR